MSGNVDISQYMFQRSEGDPLYDVVHVRAGRKTLVPHPYDKDRKLPHYPARVEITVSPTGRSVQVHVNGKKVWP